MESSKQIVPVEPEPESAPSTCSSRLFKLMKNLQILLVLAEFALTILFIRSDDAQSDKCIDPEAKTKLVIILIILQLIFGIVIILNNFHKFYERILLPSAISLVIYLNARYAYLYILFINVYYYREKQGHSTQLPECYVPIWFDLTTLVFFHIFMVQLYFHLKAISKSGSTATSTTDKAPTLSLPSYSQVQRNPTKYPIYVTEATPAPAYIITEVKNPIESV